MQTIVLILVLAITVEALIQYGKTIRDVYKRQGQKYGAGHGRGFRESRVQNR